MNKIFWSFFLLLCFIITLPVSWWMLAKLDFAYPVLYETTGIKENIARYAPKNIYRHDFEKTDKAQRLALFNGIVKSIQNGGEGLEKLTYQDSRGRTNQLLTKAEITHLQDVSNLLKKALMLAIASALIWLLLMIYFRLRRIELPRGKQLMYSAALMLLVIAGILALGPEKVFNQLHIWAFPKDHQWFFYYEESLMSTMMKAPDLFAYIAAIWFLVAAVLTFILCRLTRTFLSRRSPVGQ